MRYPPIAALRAFETASRHLNFTRAADELNITQSAVSHQIRHIEELWNFKLFEKRGRRLLLTEAGQAVVPVVREFLTKLTVTVQDLQSGDDGRSVKVSLLQSLAVKWLVPRLGSFNEQHPNVDIWISTSEDLVDFSNSDVDLAIRLGHDDVPGLHTIPLLHEYVFPVCSPRFLRKIAMPSVPEDLMKYPLIHRNAVDICPRWRDWFSDAGVQVRSLPKGMRMSDSSMAIQAAMDGQGIALARSAHVTDDLDAGRLVKLFDVYSPSSVTYFIVCPTGNESKPCNRAFIDWLLQQAKISQMSFDRYAGDASNSLPAASASGRA